MIEQVAGRHEFQFDAVRRNVLDRPVPQGLDPRVAAESHDELYYHSVPPGEICWGNRFAAGLSESDAPALHKPAKKFQVSGAIVQQIPG